MTAIDNDGDGIVEYVLYLQETLTQVIAKSDSKETTTLNTFNSNKAIDNEDIVTEADLAEGDLVLTVSYGGKYHVSTPNVVTGQMESYSSSKTKEQTITVGGTEYHPSYIQYKADTADNTYEFDVLKCDNGGVEFDSDYDFILDSNGNVIAYRPSEQGLYDYALVLEIEGSKDTGFKTDRAKLVLTDGSVKTVDLSKDYKNDKSIDQYDIVTYKVDEDNEYVLKEVKLTQSVTNSATFDLENDVARITTGGSSNSKNTFVVRDDSKDYTAYTGVKNAPSVKAQDLSIGGSGIDNAKEQVSAYWYCKSGDIVTARGECPGTLAYAPQGENGFGYDPIFFVPEKKKTFAQLTAEEKNAISHRGRALQLFQEKLAAYLAGQKEQSNRI